MIPLGGFVKKRGQAALSLAERKGHQNFAFDLEEVEGEIDPNRRPRARRLAALHIALSAGAEPFAT